MAPEEEASRVSAAMVTYAVRVERLRSLRALSLDEVFLETEKDLVEMAWSCLMERVLASPAALGRATAMAVARLEDRDAVQGVLRDIRLEQPEAA